MKYKDLVDEWIRDRFNLEKKSKKGQSGTKEIMNLVKDKKYKETLEKLSKILGLSKKDTIKFCIDKIWDELRPRTFQEFKSERFMKGAVR